MDKQDADAIVASFLSEMEESQMLADVSPEALNYIATNLTQFIAQTLRGRAGLMRDDMGECNDIMDAFTLFVRSQELDEVAELLLKALVDGEITK